MQGQLRGEYISGLIETECAHCHSPLHIQVDSNLKFEVKEPNAHPVFFVPQNGVQPGASSIIDGF